MDKLLPDKILVKTLNPSTNKTPPTAHQNFYSLFKLHTQKPDIFSSKETTFNANHAEPIVKITIRVIFHFWLGSLTLSSFLFFILFIPRLQKFYRVLAQILIFHRHLRLNKPELRLAALLSKKHDYEGQAVVLRELLL